MKKSTKDIIIIGFALFAMFFGAGNLIFPPSLGNQTGTSFNIAIIGFILTGVGLPLISILACANCGGDFKNISDRVGKKFSLIFNVILMLTLGPLLAIPRTAATTYELGVQPMAPWISPLVIIVIYFGINIFFLLRPSSIIDTIGKFLTPGLLIMLCAIIIKGIIDPFSTINAPVIDNVFTSSFLEGYNTMDALGAVIFATIVINSVKSKGYKSKSDVLKFTLKSGLVALAGLALIYGGLTYLGAQTSSMYPSDTSKATLVIAIAKNTLGNFGTLALGVAVSLACLTTSIGLSATICEFFEKETKGKLSYKTLVFIISAVSASIATLGVDNIIKFAVPILGILYPLVMVMIFTSFVYKYVGSKVIRYTTYTTLLISVLDTLKSLGIMENTLNSFLSKFPLNSIGFTWVVPSIAVFVLSYLIQKSTSKGSIEDSEPVTE